MNARKRSDIYRRWELSEPLTSWKAWMALTYLELGFALPEAYELALAVSAKYQLFCAAREKDIDI